MTPSAAITTPCPKHPSVASIGTCSRCGAFGCRQCLTDDGQGQTLCAACIERGVSGLPSLDGRAKIATTLMWAMAGLQGAMGVTDVLPGSAKDIVGGLVALVFLVAFIVAIVFFCRWFHLAVRVAAVRGINVGRSPASAVGSWFIPFVNLVRPFEITRHILGGSGGDQSAVSTWQALWIVGNIMSNISTRVNSPMLSLASNLLLVGAAVTCAGIIRKVTFGLSGGNVGAPLELAK